MQVFAVTTYYGNKNGYRVTAFLGGFFRLVGERWIDELADLWWVRPGNPQHGIYRIKGGLSLWDIKKRI